MSGCRQYTGAPRREHCAPGIARMLCSLFVCYCCVGRHSTTVWYDSIIELYESMYEYSYSYDTSINSTRTYNLTKTNNYGTDIFRMDHINNSRVYQQDTKSMNSFTVSSSTHQFQNPAQSHNGRYSAPPPYSCGAVFVFWLFWQLRRDRRVRSGYFTFRS